MDVSQFTEPVLFAELDLPGTNMDVAVDAGRGLAVLAAGGAGLHIVDISNPMAPVLRQTVAFANAVGRVEVRDGVAYTTAGDTAASVDLSTGELLQILDLGGALTDLVFEGDTLFTMDSARTLRAMAVDGVILTPRGSMAVSSGGGKLFLGDGVAYVAAGDGSNGGFLTVDVRNPDDLKLLSGVDNNAVAGTALALNGSGLAVAVGSSTLAFGGFRALDVMNAADPSNTGDFLTRIDLPAVPSDVALANGLAFVGDGTAGLQIVNYSAFDVNGQRPTMDIVRTPEDVDPVAAGIQVQEGQTTDIGATLTDDVQVRNVELLVNGQVVSNDVAFPFDLSTILPTIAAGGSNQVRLQVRATDTGGNVTLSDPIEIQLVPDVVAPRLLAQSVIEGTSRGQSKQSFTFTFSEALDEATVNASTFRLIGPDEVAVTPLAVELRERDQTVQITYDSLPLGQHRFEIEASQVADRAGNVVGAAVLTTHFTVQHFTIEWINLGDGSFTDPANWSGGRLPNATDDVLISIPFGTTVTLGSGAITALRVVMPGGGTLAVSGGVLNVTGEFTTAGGILLSLGALRLDGASTIAELTQSSGIGALTGTGVVTVTGQTTLTGGSMTGTGTTIAAGGLSISGFGIHLDQGRVLENRGTASWTRGSIRVSPTSNPVGMLRNAAGAMFETNFDGAIDGGASVLFDNAGTFRKTGGAGTTSIDVTFSNGGTVEIEAGTVALTQDGTHSGSFTGAGTLRFNGRAQTLTDTSSVTTANVVVNSGTVTMAGLYDASGTTTVSGGTVTFTGEVTNMGTALVVTVGTANLDSSSTTAGALTQSGGTLAGTGVMTVSGRTTLTNGFMIGTGTTIAAGGLSISGAGIGLDQGRVLENRAAALWTGGNVDLNPMGTADPTAGILRNAAGAVFETNFNGSVLAPLRGGTDNGASALFENAGTFRKTGGTGMTLIDVAFSNPGTVEVQAGTLELSGDSVSSGSLTGAGTLRFNSGTQTLTATSGVSIANAIISSGNVTVAGTYDSSGTTTVNGGTAIFTGAVTNIGTALVVTSGTANLSSSSVTLGALTQSGGTVSGTSVVRVNGQTTLTGGLMLGTGPTIAAAGLAISGAGIGLDQGRALENRGTGLWTGGSVDLNPTSTSNPAAGILRNTVGAVFETNFNGSMIAPLRSSTDNGASALFENLGTFRKTGGTGTTSISVAFSNPGAVEIQTGTVTLDRDGTHSGSFTGAGTLRFNGGTQTLTDASSLTTANVLFSTGSVTVAGTYNASGTTTVSGGTVSVTGTVNNIGTALMVTGGTANLSSGSVTAGALTQSGGTLSGTGVVTVSGQTTLTGGSMVGTGTTIAAGGLSISSLGIGLDQGRILETRGMALWTGGSINLNPAGTSDPADGILRNAAGAVFETTFNGSVIAPFRSSIDNGASALFENLGTFRKTGGTGTTSIGVAFSNPGTVEIQTGTVAFDRDGMHSGSFTGAATLRFNGGTQTLTGTSSVTTANVVFSIGSATVAGTYDASGTTTVNGGAVNFTGAVTNMGTALVITVGTANLSSGSVTVGALTQSGGTLSGTGVVTVNGQTTLTGGSMIGTGTTIAAGGLSIGGAGIGLDQGRILENRGTALWTGGTINLNPTGTSDPAAGILRNAAAAIFETNFNGSVIAGSFGGGDNGASALFENLGTFRKTGGTGTTLIGVAFSNPGTVEVLTGTVSLGQSFTNAGIVSIGSAGSLSITGSLTLLSTARLEIDLGATNFSDVLVSGAVTLHGVLAIGVDAGVDPVVGQTFRFMTHASRMGTFSTLEGTVLADGDILQLDLAAPLSLSLVVT